jgi:hypothetical protein
MCGTFSNILTFRFYLLLLAFSQTLYKSNTTDLLNYQLPGYNTNAGQPYIDPLCNRHVHGLLQPYSQLLIVQYTPLSQKLHLKWRWYLGL